MMVTIWTPYLVLGMLLCAFFGGVIGADTMASNMRKGRSHDAE